MNISKKLIYLYAAVLTAILSVGCSQSDNGDDPDDPGFEEGIPTEVRITLSSRSANATRAEKGDGDPKDPTKEVELIHDGWWIVFIDKNDKMRIIGQNDPSVTDRVKTRPSTVPDPDETTTDGGFEAETFKIIIPSGTYRIYAFANVPRKTDEEFEGFRKKDSKPWMHTTVRLNDILGTDRFINNSTDPAIDGMQWPSDKNIPMSGVMTEKVIKNTVEEAINIEVVRAVAKVEFEFTNPTDEKITVKKLEFEPISNDNNISFIPNNSAVGFHANEKIYNDVKKTGTLTFSDLDLTPGISGGKASTLEFYCKESLAPLKEGADETKIIKDDKTIDESQLDYFTIKLSVSRNDADPETKVFKTPTLQYINRNDWIKIPIEFSNWKILWKLRAYPPIGGYPPVFDQDEDGTKLSARVATGGEFELYPYLIKNGNNTYYEEGSNIDQIDWTKDITVEVVEDKNNILMKDSKDKYFIVDATRKVIAGELDPKKTGVAKVQISFHLNASTGITEVRTCNFTINRQNSASN